MLAYMPQSTFAYSKTLLTKLGSLKGNALAYLSGRKMSYIIDTSSQWFKPFFFITGAQVKKLQALSVLSNACVYARALLHI
jgi:hypothetical protein